MKTQILDRAVDDAIEHPPDGGLPDDEVVTDPVGLDDDDQTDERG
jgi:hypothetical protein